MATNNMPAKLSPEGLSYWVMRFRNYAAPRILMTSAIGVAKMANANRPIAPDAPQAPSQATLGFLPFPPPRQRQYRCRTLHSPILPLPGV